jgi:uncharacterized protein (DUF1499 family)
MTVLFAILAGTAVFFVGVRVWMSRDAEAKAHPDEVVDFATFDPGGRQNVSLMCPPDSCPKTGESAHSPTFTIPWQRLRDQWEEMARQQPRTAQVWSDAERKKLVYVQRSAFFQFPDTVTVEFRPAGDNGSTLAVASQSRYGRRDFGVNQERIAAWTGRLVGMMRKEDVATPR